MSSSKTTGNPLHVKNVISLLCKHLEVCVGHSFKPEYFRLAKYDKADDDVAQAFWTSLHTLSRQVVKNIGAGIDFDRYANHHATKLYFAFLKYPIVEFYALSPGDNSCNRELLLAFGWLVASEEATNIAIRAKLATSVLSHECSRVENSSKSPEDNLSSSLAKFQMREIAHTCGRISHNAKEIAELSNEKIKLSTKIHAASLNASGLPHLSVSQVSLTKNLSIIGRSNISVRDEKHREELKSIAAILETHARWKKSEGIFHDWMVTVIEEKKYEKKNVQSDAKEEISRDELSRFLSILRHVTKKKIHSVREKRGTREVPRLGETCCSRFSRTQEEQTEVESSIAKTAEDLNIIETDVRNKMKILTEELRKMLNSIPNCVEI